MVTQVIHALEHSAKTNRPLWVLLHANIQADWYHQALNRIQAEKPVYRCYVCNENGDNSFIWSHLALR